MRLSIRGAIKNGEWNKSLRNCITDDAGNRLVRGQDVLDFLLEELSKGHEFLPFARVEPGKTFNRKTGEIEEATHAT